MTSWPDFDALQVTLSEPLALIEASAGTGKTYALVRILLRRIAEGDAVSSLLTVTFTRAATSELRGRLRAELQSLLSSDRDDSLYTTLSGFAGSSAQLDLRLTQALRALPTAPILTIHGFAQRTLQEYALESSVSPDLSLYEDIEALADELANAYWREAADDFPTVPSSVLKDLRSYARVRLEHPAETIITAWLKPSAIPRTCPTAELHSAWDAECAALLNALQGKDVFHQGRKHVQQANGAATYAELESLVAKPNQVHDGEAWKAARTAALAKALKRGQESPCPSLSRALDAYSEYIGDQLARFTQSFIDEFENRRKVLFENRSITTHSYSLTQLLDALETRPALAETLGQRFKVALIDEFQDTDPQQFRILSRIFTKPEHRVVVVGDPKQAIYSFRGGDLHSYLSVADKAQQRYSLRTNYRSSASFIRACNRFFSLSRNPFVLPEIEFVEQRAAPHRAEHEVFIDDASVSPLQLVRTAENAEPAQENADENRTRVARGMAEHLLRLLESAYITEAESSRRTVSANDVAIIVRAHSEAAIIAQALAERGIPFVRQSKVDVFSSEAANTLGLLMRAMLSHEDPSWARAVLLEPIHALRLDELVAADSESLNTKLADAFAQASEQWHSAGIQAAFQEIAGYLGWRGPADSESGSLRTWTDIYHLLELLQNEAAKASLTPAGLLRWFERTRQQANRENREDWTRRLETEEDAVRIVTMHASKGLDYGIVYVPFALRHVGSVKSPYPVKNEDDSRSIETRSRSEQNTSDLYPPSYEQAASDQLAEECRLLYVAITRARHACILGCASPAKHRSKPLSESGLCTLLGVETEEDCHTTLKGLAETSGGDIDLVTLPTPSSIRYKPKSSDKAVEALTSPPSKVSYKGLATSFSGLIIGRKDESPDRDNSVRTVLEDTEDGVDAIHDFPAGTRSGNFFHAWFEHVFPLKHDLRFDATVSFLDQYGFDPNRWADDVFTHLMGVLDCELKCNDQIFRLSEVPAEACLFEAEFTMPFAPLRAEQLASVFSAYAASNEGIRPDFVNSLRRLNLMPTEGVLRGFIDLIVRIDNTCFILDWKSNKLGPSNQAYHPQALHRSMDTHLYPLQYHLYAVALRRQLGSSYELKGALYCFLRGMTPQSPGQGVVSDSLNLDLLAQLDQLFPQP